MSRKRRVNKPTFPGKYTGELATPIYEPLAGGVGGLGGSKAEVERRTVEQRILKMEKLFDWYSIDPDEPDAGMCLAARLALVHVPGMQVRHELRKRGRKPSWKDGLGIQLVRDVAALQQTKKMNYEQAIEVLCKNKGPWRDYTLPTLITRHREARKVEQNRRRIAEHLKASPISEAMGTVFGMAPTDENSSDQN
jgi:hypothetical protein